MPESTENYCESEIPKIVADVIFSSSKYPFGDVKTIQDIILQIRVVYQAMDSTLRAKKVDSAEPIIKQMVELSAVALRSACFLENRRRASSTFVDDIQRHEIETIAVRKKDRKKMGKVKKTQPLLG